MQRGSAVRMGMIGCGLIAQAHGLAARALADRVRFTACTSRTAAGAGLWASTFGIEPEHAYDNLDAMLDRERLEAVVIATWPADHRRHIETCLEHGVRYILCEKPLVTRAADAYAVWTRARDLDAVIMEGFMYRHHPALRQVRDHVHGGGLGALDSIHATFHMPQASTPEGKSTSWRQQPEAGGGVPHDFLSYPVDAAGWLCGDLPLRAAAFGARSSHNGTVDRVYGLIEYAAGCVASVASSRHAVFDQCLEIAAAKAHVRLPVAWTIVGDAEITESRSTGFITRSETHTRVAAQRPAERLIDLPVFASQLDNFLQVMSGSATPAVPLRDSVVNAFVIDALLQAIGEDRTVAVTLPADVAATFSSNSGGHGDAV